MKLSLKSLGSTALAAAFAAAVSTAAHGQVISVNFEGNTAFNLATGMLDTFPVVPPGPNAVVTPGTFNNVLADGTGANDTGTVSGSAIPLVFSDGTTSGASLSYSAPGEFNAAQSMTATEIANSPNEGLLSDYILANSSGSADATITGLVSGGIYNVYAYTGSDNSGRDTNFSVDGGSTETATYNSSDTTFVTGDNYVEFANITATGGTITITAANGSQGEGDFDGFQLQAVPEPTSWTMALGGVGLLVGLARLRRLHQA